MSNCAMLVCSFFVKKRFTRKNSSIYNLNQEIVCDIDDSSESFSSYFDILRLFCDNNRLFLDDKKQRKMFSVQPDSLSTFDCDSYRVMSFVVKSGSYGVEADMTNRYTSKVSYHRTEDEADVKAFQCVTYIPKDTPSVNVQKGIMVFQSIATYGVKTITINTMRNFLSKYGLTLETRSVSVQVFLQKLMEQGSLYKIMFFSNRISPNIADNIFISTGREVRSYIRPKFHSEGFSKILDMFEKAENGKVIEIPDDSNFEDISIQFKLGERTRTIRLNNLDRLSIVEDIPDGVIDKNDNSKLVQYMIKTADAYKEKIVFDSVNEG